MAVFDDSLQDIGASSSKVAAHNPAGVLLNSRSKAGR
jgi:hypothetical protein